MKMEITQKKENPLQKRVEVYFTIDHKGEATPAGTPSPRRSPNRPTPRGAAS